MSEQVKRFYAPGLDCMYRDNKDAPRELIPMVLGTDYDALHQRLQALEADLAETAEIGTQEELRANRYSAELVRAHGDLEAARGLLERVTRNVPQLFGHPGLLSEIGDFLTATPAPEVRQDEDAWQTLHALSKAPQDGEKMTAERLHAICEVGHDRKAFVARLAEQGERQEAFIYALMRDGDPVVLDWASDEEVAKGWVSKGYHYLPLYTTPQPGPDVRRMVEALQKISTKTADRECRELNSGGLQQFFVEIMTIADEALATHRQAQQGDIHDT